MHLWPSTKIRDSFKFANLQNYERNLRRMNSEKQSAAIKQKLLQREGGDTDREAAEGEASRFRPPSAIGLWGRDLLAVLSCFYCCYTWEDCVDQEC
ncbi:uncharacterized protein LOC115753499 [Rhodamnia argentea]|uniref:Uncharacterized protein LOC115753499 n=1 Tax=Rhodamnia argentea TaxID=178133 RepID=A0A8B8QLS5_9MYRT|nr:uncharacterized protein LOC115753499 [Rhodamnia argentea]